MTRLHRILIITFLESFGTVTLERGVHFFTHDRLGFSSTDNLWLATVFGVTYIVGALVSHRVAERVGEKRLLQGVLVASVAVHVGLGMWATGPSVFAAMIALGLLNGLKWPVIESYVGAGRTGREQAKAVGWFNISWASSVPVSLVAAGPLIEFWPSGLFWVPAVINGVALMLVLKLPLAPAHLEHDHPDRPDALSLAKSRSLLVSARWSMLASYSLLFVASPILPEVFDRLGVAVVAATALAGLLDVCRLGAFVWFRQWSGWHGKVWPVAVVVALLPVGFGVLMFSPEISELGNGTWDVGEAEAVGDATWAGGMDDAVRSGPLPRPLPPGEGSAVAGVSTTIGEVGAGSRPPHPNRRLTHADPPSPTTGRGSEGVNWLGVLIAVAGSVVFGLACGVTYYAALYYGLLVKNASVDAGGAHEGLIGAGFALGPAAGLVGTAVLPGAGAAMASLVGIGPVVVVCVVGAGVALKRGRVRHEGRKARRHGGE